MATQSYLYASRVGAFLLGTFPDPNLYEPSIATLGDGGFAVSYYSNQVGVRYRVFNADGTERRPEGPLGPAFESGCVLTQLSNGSFMAVWVEADTSGTGIMGQLFDSLGTPISARFPVNTSVTAGSQSSIDVTAGPNGNFMVTWQDGAYPNGTALRGGVYDAQGAVIKADFLIEDTVEYEVAPRIATLANGNFIVTWQPLSASQHHAKIYSGSGDVVKPDFIVATEVGGQNDTQVAALADGGFVVAYTSTTGSSSDIAVQIHNADGSLRSNLGHAIGGLVNEELGGLTAIAGGEFFTITYSSGNYEGRPVYAQSFNLHGNTVGTPQLVGLGSAREIVGFADKQGGSFVVTSLDAYYSKLAGVRTYATAGSYELIQRIEGDGTAETLIGSGLSDYIFGADGDDVLAGGGFTDALYGEGGRDMLVGGAGADILDGGANADTAFYGNSTSAVFISLQHGEAHGGEAQGDRLLSIEGLYGSAFGDSLSGNALGNDLAGLGGNDYLEGLGGSDLLVGGDGFDTASYLISAGGVLVNLIAGTGQSHDANGDLLVGIENVYGSASADYLIGDTNANLLLGASGDDLLFGEGGGDILIGGAHNDVLTGGGGDDFFFIRNNEDRDVVVDFDQNGNDVIAFADFGAGFSLSDLNFTATANGILVTAAGWNGSLLLQNAPFSLIGIDDFMFV